MQKVKIDSTLHQIYPQFLELYKKSFPLCEQRTNAELQKAIANKNFSLFCYTQNGALLGFVSFWDFKNCVYIEHLAVNDTMRNCGIGSKIMQDVLAGSPKIFVLEVDYVVDEISAKRMRFYKRCGFFETPHKHAHPGYGNGPKCPMAILSTQRPISESEYADFYHNLLTIAMDNQS